MAARVVLDDMIDVDDLESWLEEEKRRLTAAITPEELAAKTKLRVKGQDHFVDDFSEAIAINLARKQKGMPIFVGVIAGPPSTGKTEYAKAVTEAIYGDEKYLVTIDCGEYPDEQRASVDLFGGESIYSNSKPGTLTSKMEALGQGVLLLDEIEKLVKGPDSLIGYAFYSMFDEGRVKDKFTGRTIDLSKWVILMTSNAQENLMRELVEKFRDDAEMLATQCKIALTDAPFSNALLSRIHRCTSTAPLTQRVKLDILAGKIASYVQTFGLDLYRPTDKSKDPPSVDRPVFGASLKWLENPKNLMREYEKSWFPTKSRIALFNAQRAGARVVRLGWDDAACGGQGGVVVIPMDGEGGASAGGVSPRNPAQRGAAHDAPLPRMEQHLDSTAPRRAFD